MSQLFSGKDTLPIVAKHAEGMSLRYGVVDCGGVDDAEKC